MSPYSFASSGDIQKSRSVSRATRAAMISLWSTIERRTYFPQWLQHELFHFIFAWNDFLGPLLYLPHQQSFTLAIGLQFYQSQHGGTQWHLLMAASMLTVLPVILLFFFTQRTRSISTPWSSERIERTHIPVVTE